MGASNNEDTETGEEEKEITFGDRWGWLYYVDLVSELTHTKWSEVFEMNIYEFFNLLSYRKDKNAEMNKSNNPNRKVY